MSKYCVYEHISPSGKRYIGITRTSVEERWGHQGYGYRRQLKFYNAIQKYGWDNFKHNIIKTGLTKEQAELLEKELIKKFDCINNGYNICEGGNVLEWTDEMRLKASLAHKGKQTWWKGRKHTEETKNKMKEAHKNRQKGKPLRCVETNIIYPNAKEAAISLGLDANCSCNITRVANNPNRIAYGYHWIRI